jgi:hypothetical protein
MDQRDSAEGQALLNPTRRSIEIAWFRIAQVACFH